MIQSMNWSSWRSVDLPPRVRTRIGTRQSRSTIHRLTKWREPEPTRGIFDIFTKMEIHTTGHGKERIKQQSKKMVLRKRRGRGPGRTMEEPASLRILKAVARLGGRPRQKGLLLSGKAKWNTNVRPRIVSTDAGDRIRASGGCIRSPRFPLRLGFETYY